MYVQHSLGIHHDCPVLMPAFPHRRPHYPIAEAELVALFVQSVTFGAHAVTFVICMHRWLRRLKTPDPNSKTWPWVVVAVALFGIGAVDVILNFYHNLAVFVFRDPAEASSHFRMISEWINTVRVSVVSISIVVV